jgi:DNA-binding CsgD family transcriptional regulator
LDHFVIGRTRELAVIDAWLERAQRSAASLRLEGEPGMGKTTLWLAGVERGAERGCRVLASRPADAEATFAYAAIGDLLEAVDDETIAELPGPQARAIRVALLREEPTAGSSHPSPTSDPRAVAVAFLNLVRRLARDGALLVAVDDTQWLDSASAQAIAFALRRLRDEPVGFLLARRLGADARPEGGRDASLAAVDTERLLIGPIDVTSVGRLIESRLGRALAHPTVVRVHAASAGNPFFAVELARTIEHEMDGGIPAGDAVAAPGLPESLRDLLGARIAALPPATGDALAVTAALSVATLDRVSAGVDGDAATLLTPAVEAGIVEVDEGRLRFTHPLLATAAWEATPAGRRREIHGRLADVVGDREERARHLALAADGPDEAVAAALEEAAWDARNRGAPGTTAELAGLAVRRTPPDRVDDARRRALLEAEHALIAGDAARARRLNEGLLAAAAPGRPRAEVLTLQAIIDLQAYDLRGAVDVLREALSEADDDRLRMRCEGLMTAALDDLETDVEEAIAHGRAERELAERLGDEVHVATALRGIARNELRRSGRWPTATIDRAMAGEAIVRAARSVHEWPSVCLADMEGWTDDVGSALARLEELQDHARDRGEEPAQSWLLARTIALECVIGAWPAALRHVDDCLELVGDEGHPLGRSVVVANRSLVRAHLGDVAGTRRDADEATRTAAESRAVMAERTVAWSLGLLELSLGDPQAAHAHLDGLVGAARAAGIREPGALRFVPDDIEALVASGRLDEAGDMLAWYASLAEGAGRVHAIAAADRCRGLLRSARDDQPGAIEALEASRARYATVAFPFDEARTLLALGAAQRRAGRRRDARATLETALAAFGALGAERWVATTRRELAAISGRTGGGNELTVAERRVAELVAEGRTNREVAAALYLTERTVESHLSRVYAKIGVRSRTELAAAWPSIGDGTDPGG